MDITMSDTRRFINHTLRKHLFPVIMSVLLVQLCTIVNNMIVGRLIGSEGLAVMSAVNPLFFAYATLGALLGVGGSMQAAYYLGKNDKEKANGAFTLSLTLMAALGVLGALLGLLFIEPLMSLLSVPAPLRGMARDYLRVYLTGGIAHIGIYLPFNFMKLAGKQRQSVAIFGAMAVVDAALGLYLVIIRGMGLRGVAIAAVAANAVAAVSGTLVLLRGDFRLINLPGKRAALARLCRVGSPAAINNLCNTLRALCLNRLLLGVLGSYGLTSLSLIATVTSFSIAISSGVSQTVAPFIGVFAAERDNVSIRQLMRQALIAGLTLMSAFVLLVAALREQICALFKTADPALLAVAAPAIALYAVSLIPAMLNYLLIAVNQANRRALIANTLIGVRAFAGVVGAAWLLSAVAGPRFVWLGFLCAELLCLGCYALIARAFSARHAHISPVLLLDTEAEQSGRYISFSVPSSAEAAAQSAERITDFCDENALSPKRAMAVSLAIEELITLYVKYALAGKAGEDVNVRILISKEQVTMRIRCGGKPFDPIAAFRRDEDMAGDALGLTMVSKLATYVHYEHTFGVNNLTLIL